MRSFQSVAASIAFSALMAAGATCAGAEDEPLGVRLVDQMNALYGAHPGVRANHAKGAVFEGMFTPAQGADALSSAVFLKGAPTPLVIRFSNSGGVPDAPDTHPSTDGVRGMAIKFRLSDGSEADMVCISANGFPVATGEDFLALLQAVGASGPDVPKPTPVEKFLSTHPAALLLSRRRGLWRSATARSPSSASMRSSSPMRKERASLAATASYPRAAPPI
jgi:catalase